jgi:hypothetical protein
VSTTLNLNAPRTKSSRRVRVLAAASALVAAASITVTLAVTAGSDTSSRPPAGAPATAQPDRATLYAHGVSGSGPSATIDGQRAAERFHHR